MIKVKLHNFVFCWTLPALIACNLAYSETFVAGEVAGHWEADRSPYIVIDSTWIPEDRELVIHEGVTVLFEDGLGLYAYGGLTVQGSEEDSVIFRVRDRNELVADIYDIPEPIWAGIWLLNRNLEYSFSYSSIKDTEHCLVLPGDVTLALSHSSLRSNHRPLGSTPNDDGYNRNDVSIDQCVIDAGRMLAVGRGRLIISDSEIWAGRDPTRDDRTSVWGINAESSRLEIDNSTVIGIVGYLYPSSSRFSNCQFLRSPGGFPVEVSLMQGAGGMINCYVQGEVDVGGRDEYYIPIRDCVIDSMINGNFTGEIKNTRIGGRLYLHSDGTDVLVEDCRLGEKVRCTLIKRAVFRNCVMPEFVGTNRTKLFFLGDWDAPEGSELVIDQCLIRGKIALHHPHPLQITNNTFYIDSTQSPLLNVSIVDEVGGTIRNNIFASLGYNEGFMAIREDSLPDMQYNCISGFEYLTYHDQEPEFQLDETNIYDDPRFADIEWGDYRLTADSPCIDAGDPDLPNDPDGTRSDIGRYYFHQTLSVRDDLSKLQSFDTLEMYPNPSNSHFSLRMNLSKSQVVTVTLFDLSGRKITLFNETNTSIGKHVGTYNVTEIPTGTYFVSVSASDRTEYLKMQIVK